ncbi:NAD(P)H-binding protein [Rhodococcus sp. HNM0569]|uniref:SDR family oxidoreductase n=1 Tax=Rhodococcus sp. HNM0569 TaxID=2716340 RepID=UPI00146E4EC4|nr:NAD(P)H-binding protein [Rhodococcus sp. HNM0569]NLU82015.1 NAD(P)H-binding protein [Rhodococcus sp. HNM0569]
MATVLVAGGTGVAGRHVVKTLLRDGHAVRSLTRHGGAPGSEIDHRFADLVTGEGVADALEGVDAVVDATNGMTKSARAVFDSGTTHLLDAAHAAGVRRAVLLSIAGVDESTYSYYEAKTAQEAKYRDSPVDTVIVRATQFHDFVPMLARPTARFGVIPAPSGVRFQTIDTRDVARALVAAALGDGPIPSHPITIGGPEVRTSRDLATAWKKATGRHGLVVSMPMPGPLGEFFRAGKNLVPEATYGEITFEQWLAEP